MVITNKIQNKKVLPDGQTIYIMGTVQPVWYYPYSKEFEMQAFEHKWTLEGRGHFAVRKMIKKQFPELAKWLEENNASTTCWIDTEIYRALTSDSWNNYDWGIGFKPNDPLESWFLMRWS